MESQFKSRKTIFIDLSFIMALSLAIVLLIALISCNNPGSKPEDSKEVATDHNDAKFENEAESDANFLINAAEIDLEEIQLGQLAERQGMMLDVKKLGKMMVDEHTHSFTTLQGLAATKQITLPTSLTESGQDASKRLSDKRSEDFDKAFCNLLIDGHKDAIDKFIAASKDAKDEDIRNFAANALPALRMHLDQAITCQQKCKKI